ncbi:hypothetical protein BGW39_009770 [Mortierella sp. 14UC]|nr:hypothetical protein BGW39_009770 [Mortierella sp. 14UC]
MTLHQRFRQGDTVESIAVRMDKVSGETYSRLTDIQRIFPDTSLLKVKGVFINYLEDENEQLYEPKRIAHYPDDIIDIIVAGPVKALTTPPASISIAVMEQSEEDNPSPPSQLLSSDSIDLSKSDLSLQATLPVNSTALVCAPSQPLVCALVPPTLVALPASTLTRPIAVLTTMASDISHLQQQLERSTDQQSSHHQQLLQQLIHMQHEMVQQQTLMLQEQAAAKEREEKMLAELEAAKARDEEILKMQQQTIDRLTVAQQRVDAILVQNYELHEYPIPRLFVVLPDSFKNWDPRNFLMERFRLYFLCECEDDCQSTIGHDTSLDQLSIAAATDATTAPIPVKNSIHFAKHEGYELSRPKEFFDRYGPYVLGMLRLLRHCLVVASVVSPAVGIAENGFKDVMDGVKSLSESTMEAVDMSINILENKLSDTNASDDLAGAASDDDDDDASDDFAEAALNGPEVDDSMFENLAALEGADLRRLDTFLRNNDKDKILGNLYRITTEQGHVKWVCFQHYQERYRATALASFIEAVEIAGGAYDPHFRKVAINLKSSTSAKDFFKRLAKQRPEIQILEFALDWEFASADLVMLVDMISKSNIKAVKLDLQDDPTANANVASLRPGKGRYHSLLGLMSNSKLHGLQFSRLSHLAARTSNLPDKHEPSWLQSFRFYGRPNEEDILRLKNILSHCSRLTELRLISEGDRIRMDQGLHKVILSLKKLQRLRVVGWYREVENDTWVELIPRKEYIYPTLFNDRTSVYGNVLLPHLGLEVLVLSLDHRVTLHIFPGDPSKSPFPRTSEVALLSSPSAQRHHLFSLTHLDLQVPLAGPTLEHLSTVLPQVDLIHFGCNEYSLALLKYCNLSSLKSLSIADAKNTDLKELLDAISNGTSSLVGLECLALKGFYGSCGILPKLLENVSLRCLSLDNMSTSHLTMILASVSLSKLEMISVRLSQDNFDVRKCLERRIDECTGPLKIQLDGGKVRMQQAPRALSTPGDELPKPQLHIEHMGVVYHDEHHYRFLQHTLPKSFY